MKVPVWAMKLILEPEDMESEEENRKQMKYI